MTTLRIGQFSRSPVLAAAQQLGWVSQSGLTLEVTPVASSPAQFASLRDGEIDVALTSPDNVLLYASTDRNPLGQQFPLRIRRAIDGGLGLALVVRPEIEAPEQLAAAPVGVDVLPSGFAMLLKDLLRQQGVDPAEVNFVEEGATPRRADRLIEGAIGATILNAESRNRAEAAGMRAWSTSVAVSPIYAGTVLATVADGPDITPLLELWERTTEWLLDQEADEVATVLGAESEALGTPAYVELLRSPAMGLQRDPHISQAQLQVLADLRRAAGAWTPTDDDMRALATA